MPIKDLWKIVEPSGRRYETLSYLALEKIVEDRGSSPTIIGISIRTYLLLCGATAGARVSDIFANLFKRLCLLLRTSAVYVFVFDGIQKPVIRNNVQVEYVQPWWVEHARELISSFGFNIHSAPGDAEAELAALNRCGIFDSIMTNSSITLAYGATKVLRTPNLGARGTLEGEVFVYTNSSIATRPETWLSHAGLILFSMLNGGTLNGGTIPCISGITTDTSLEIAQCGFGERIVSAARLPVDADALARIRNAWRHDLHDKLQEYGLAIPPLFPDMQTVNSLVNPLTSLSDGFIVPDTAIWNRREPSIPRLTRFCRVALEWSNYDLPQLFKQHLWAGVFLQSLISCDSIVHDGRLVTPRVRTRVTRITMPIDKDSWYPLVGRQVTFHVNVENYVHKMGIAYSDDNTIMEVRAPHILVRPEIMGIAPAYYRDYVDSEGTPYHDQPYEGLAIF